MGTRTKQLGESKYSCKQFMKAADLAEQKVRGYQSALAGDIVEGLRPRLQVALDASKTFDKKLETLKIELVSKLDQSNKSVETLIGTIKDTTGAYVSNADATRKLLFFLSNIYCTHTYNDKT